MTDNFVKLKDEIKHLYSEEVISDAELNQMTKNLIDFFTVGIVVSKKDKEESCISKIPENK